MKLQVAEGLKTALFSVSKLERSGNTVVFDEERSFIYNRCTNSYTPLRKHNGAYVIDIWVKQSDPCNQLTGKTAPVLEDTSKAANNGSVESDEEVFARLPYD